MNYVNFGHLYNLFTYFEVDAVVVFILVRICDEIECSLSAHDFSVAHDGLY